MKTWGCAITIMAIGGLATTSQAAEFLDVDQPTHTTIWGGPVGERQSQGFTTGPTTEYITAIEFKTWNPDPVSASLTLTLRILASDFTQNPDPLWETGAVLATKSETFVGASDSDWLRFEFEVPVDVNPNTTYTAFFTNTAGSNAGYYRSTVDAYTGTFNLNKRYQGLGWDHVGFVSDLAFRVYGDTEFPVVILEVDEQVSDSLCFVSEAGKLYWLQATTDMVTSSNWETVGATIAGDGGVKYLFDPTEPTGSSTSKLYRILGN